MLALLCAQQAATMCSWPSLALFVTELGVPIDSVGTVTGLVVFAQSLPVIFIAARWTAYGKRLGGNTALAMALCANGTVAVLIGAVAWRIEIVIALRLLSGAAIAGFIPLVFDRISGSVPPQARGRIAGLASTAMMTGSLLGPITGAWLAVHLGIGATFWVPGLMLFAIGIVLAATKVRTQDED
jgi:MFS family permease